MNQYLINGSIKIEATDTTDAVIQYCSIHSDGIVTIEILKPLPQVHTVTALMNKQNWFETLSQALESEGLSQLWPLGSNIGYGENVRHNVNGRLISIYRETDGRYERPIHYRTGSEWVTLQLDDKEWQALTNLLATREKPGKDASRFEIVREATLEGIHKQLLSLC